MPPLSPISIVTILPLTLGAVYVGATIAAVFYGITILQTVIYYKQYPNDPWIFRYGVAGLWILDILHVILSTHALYFYMVESFGNDLALFSIIWSFPVPFFPASSICERLKFILSVAAAPGWYVNRRWSASLIRRQNMETWSEYPYGHTMGHPVFEIFENNLQFLAVAASLGETSFVITSEDLNATLKAPEYCY
ncbi:hypothetical protein F5146DRAFT_1144608 [Armillaria mellea]|nr:hypothetical protein F5146DRAFT_1144608 [Armillaria mellea]